jgi:hypothetical protein
MQTQLGEVTAMDELAAPFVRLWNYVHQTGGYPGQILFCTMVVMLIIGFLTWFGNKK